MFNLFGRKPEPEPTEPARQILPNGCLGNSTPKRPIEDFALARIEEKTGGIDLKKAYKLDYAKDMYSAEIYNHVTQVKRGNGPDLHKKEVKTRLVFHTNSDHTPIWVSTHTYWDGEFQNYGGSILPVGCSPPLPRLDDAIFCELLNTNWPTFLAALDSIAAQIKADCDAPHTRGDGGCKKEILKKIQESRGV